MEYTAIASVARYPDKLFAWKQKLGPPASLRWLATGLSTTLGWLPRAIHDAQANSFVRNPNGNGRALVGHNGARRFKRCDGTDGGHFLRLVISGRQNLHCRFPQEGDLRGTVNP
jgi:hypothetical protein